MVEALKQEKESDRKIMEYIFTEYCEKANNFAACPFKDKCLKAHLENNQILRRNPFSPNYTQITYLAT